MGYAQTLAVFAADFNNRTPEERNSHDRRVAAQLAFWCVSRHNMIAYPFHGILPSPYSNSRVTEIIRQIFGNLFQPPEENQIWLKNKELWMTEDVIHTAASIYATRANPLNDVGILADALDDTGDAAEWLTSHMRLPGPHYRGCWYIDILLGKHDA
jgi:hypothetical protein